MARTGGTLSAKMIELIGDLHEGKTETNVKEALRNIEKKLSDKKQGVQIYVKLFGRVEDMKRDISTIQGKITQGKKWSTITLGAELGDISVKDINAQIEAIEDKFKSSKTGSNMKLEIDFDFKGSASKIKEEMDGIKQFMQRYGDQMKNMDIVNMDGSSKNVKKNTEEIKGSISNMGSETKKATKDIGNQIKKEMEEATGATGRFSVSYKRDVEGAIVGANASIKSADGTMESFKYTLNETGDMLGQQSRATKIAGDATERYAKQVATVEDAQNKLNRAVKNAPEGFSSQAFKDSQASIDEARRSLEQHKKATDVADKAMASFSNTLKITKKDLEFRKEIDETKRLNEEFQRLGGSDKEVQRITNEIQRLSQDGTGSFDKLQSEIKESISEFQRLDSQMSKTSKKEFRTAIEEQDIATVKRYIEEMKGASVASLRLSEAKDKEGNAISRVKVNMEAQKGAVKSSTLEYDKATGKVRELDKQTKTLSESNKGLDGSFAGILSRITQYFSAMTLLQKGMQAIKNTISEIREIDARMTELARVADPSLNLDIMLERSVSLSKELGASVADVVDVVGEMARTFGEFNEEQLLAITRTATIMQNVSELTLGEASSTLVGTMKAFNIEAEDSIRIVNSFNEVDNNFAISTNQISKAMEKAGATATTFGIEMEELIGDITAIGEVTQESGERIGTALRTIYSRVTTHEKSIEILDELGISLHEMGDSGPEIRNVSDILGELGAMWNDLSKAQQQNIGLAMAGRNRLAQFLALMNNQATAVEATTTAYNSQGSAMREQREYMASYEYQMTVLGATATEVALTIEDKFVGDAMYLVVSAGTSMLETLNSIIDTIGFLPTVIGGVSTALLLLSGSFRDLALTSLPALLGKITTAIMGMGTATVGFGTALKGALLPLLPIIAKGALFVGAVSAIAFAVEKLVGKFTEAKKANEEAKLMMDEAIDAYNMHGNEIDSLIDRYEELHTARQRGELDPESEREYLDLVNQISTMLPNAVSHVDAKGQAHLRSAEAIREQAGAMDDLARSNALAMREENEDSFVELMEDLASAQERQKKASEEAETSYAKSQVSYEEYKANIDALNQSSYNHTVAMSEEAYERSVLADATEKYYEKSSIANANAFEQSALIQEATVMIGDQTVAYMNAEGQMKNVSTTAQALIRDYASMNSQVLENAEGEEELAEAREKLTADSEKFGELMVGIYDDISKGLDDIDAQKAIDQFDMLISALPEEEFAKSFDVIKQNMGSLQSIIGDVASGAEIDIDGLVSMLERAGMESNTARSYVISLGEAFENQQIRSAVAKEELTEYNEELVKTRDMAIETINPLEELFGFDSDGIKGLSSHIDLLAIMQNQYGDTWSEMDKGQASLDAIADYFDVSTDAIVDNFEMYQDVIRAMGKMKVTIDDSGKTVVEFAENTSKSTKDMVMGMLEAGDEYSGFAHHMVTETGVITKSQEEMAEKTEEINKRFKAFFENPEDIDAKNNLFNQLKDDLESLRGSLSYTEDEFGDFKLTMADGSKSGYLDNINQQLEENSLQLQVYHDNEQGLLVGIAEGADGTIVKLGALNDIAVEGSLAIDLQREAIKALIDESTSEENRESFLEVLGTQLEAFGEDLEVVGNKTEGFKIQLEGNEHNPWLVALNDLVEELGIKIDQTKNEAGELEIAFQTKDGKTIFTTATEETEVLEEKITKTKESVEKLVENPYKVDIELEEIEAVTGIDAIDRALSNVTGAKHKATIEADNSPVKKTVDDTKEKIDEIQDRKIDLSIDEKSINSYNDVVSKVTDTKLEILDLETVLRNVEKDLRLSNENMSKLMTNTENINHAYNALKTLNETVDISIDKMGDLFLMFSSDAGIDTSGIENSAQKIADEAHSIERALVSIQGYITGMNLSIRNMDTSFDITPIINYRMSVLSNAQLIESDISALAVVVRTQMAKVADAFQQGNVSLAQVKIHTSNILGQVVILHRLTGEMITNYSLKAGSEMLNNYNKGLVGILQATTTFKELMDTHFKQFYTSIVNKVTMTAVDMRSKFTDGTNDIVRIAEGLPGRIGQGIRNNISQATSSMTALASSMVTRFKRELGIHSPSRVFTELGGHVIDGLVNGLTGSDITNLGQTVFSDFSDGAISTINEIKGYMTFEPVTAGSFGAGFTKTSGFGPRKSPGGIGSTNHKGVDYGAPIGTPIPSQSSGTVIASGYNGSMGNYVRVRSGDGKVHTYMHNSRNNVGVGQTIGRGQILGLVGSTGNSTGPHVHYQVDINGIPIDPEKRFRGFAEGGFIDKKELAWHGEEGLEAIIPLIPERRDRGLELWRQSGEILGMSSELLDILMGARRKSSEYGGSSSFAGLDGEAGEGSSASGTSGIMKPDTSSIMNALGVEYELIFTSMARDEKPEALYRRDYASIRTSMHEDMVTKANIEMKALTKQTLAYRNALVLVSTQENKLKKDTESRLKSTVKRQKAIEKELETLKNTSKHTVKQRKRYNELQEEYDKNTESIMSMENSIRNLHIAMDERKVEIYIDYFKQLSKEYDTATESLERVMARSQYYLDRVSLEDENDIVKQQSWRNDVIKQTIRLEETLLNQQRLLGEEYDKAKKKYGRQSEQALFARSELIRVEDAYRSTVLERIKKEQESEKIRRDIADNGIKALKDYYSQTQKITERAIDLERKALEKAHQEKMDRYDEEISKIESVYDAKLKEMDEEKAEEEYQEQISELNEQRSELMLYISRASRDTSLEGRRRLAELQSELSDVNAEIQSTQKERHEELYRTAIDNQKKAQIEAIEFERETEEKKNEIRMSQLDKQAEDAKKYAESIINDNAFWERLSNQFVSGNTGELDALIEDMQFRMADFASGNFEGVSLGYDKLSKEDRDKLSEDALLDISNSILESNDDIKKYISASNTAIEKVTGKGYKYGTTQMTGGSGPSLSTQAQSEPTASKPKPEPSGGNKNPVLGKKVKVIDVNAGAYMDSYGRRARPWGEQAKSAGIGENQGVYLVNARNGYGAISKTNSVRGAIAWVKLDDLVGLRSGGYTGDWSGDEGKVAMLHKRELVLSEAQTRDILDVAKIIDSIAGIIPKMKVNRPNISKTTNAVQGDTYAIDNLNLNMKDFKGSEEDAKRAFDNMAKELKKRGKK